MFARKLTPSSVVVFQVALAVFLGGLVVVAVGGCAGNNGESEDISPPPAASNSAALPAPSRGEEGTPCKNDKECKPYLLCAPSLIETGTPLRCKQRDCYLSKDHCKPGEVCIDSTCVKGCWAAADCGDPKLWVCVNSTCEEKPKKPVCTTEADCGDPKTLHCLNGTCAKKPFCTTEADCGGKGVCINSDHCVPLNSCDP